MTYTNIRLKTETRDVLKSIGGKGDSYDDVIVKLLISYAEGNMTKSPKPTDGCSRCGEKIENGFSKKMPDGNRLCANCIT
jgi:hypothetical protein